jgi:predicted permease
MGVDQTFLKTMGIPLLAGRDYNASDLKNEQKVIVVNQSLVKSAFPNNDPIDRIITLDQEPHRIIGVCADIRSYDIKQATEPTIFFLNPGSSYKIRTAMDPYTLIPAVRKILAAINPAIPMTDMKTQTKQIDESIARERCFAALAISMALLAVLLACIGLYGVMAYNVERRTNEIGIRMALGATACNVAWPILRSALVLAMIGIVVSVPVVFAVVRVVRSYLFGIAPHDPMTLAGAVVSLLTVTLLAAWLPARRAAKVDPMEALRYE